MFHGLSMVFCVYHQHGLDTVVRKKHGITGIIIINLLYNGPSLIAM
jgi:hypothetical protein